MIEMWSCDCKDKMNVPGVPRCRKCGAYKPEYTTNGKNIVVQRKQAHTAHKTAHTAHKQEPKRTAGDEPENFTESKLALNDEE